MKLEVQVHRHGNIAEIRNFGDFSTISELHQEIRRELMLKGNGMQDFYLTQNGKPFHTFTKSQPDVPIIAVSKLLGGKGGFGSMLRAIGAQIEKTTNRDACRDLSGRRLRDINEEQRLKRWFAKQAEREEEKKEARKRKLEKLKQITEGPPLPKMDDQDYNKQRAEMSDSVYAAVDYCFEEAAGSSSTKATSSSTTSSGSASPETETNESEKSDPIIPPSSKSIKEEKKLAPKPAKIKKLMMDDDLDSDCSSDSDEDNEKAVAKV